MPSFFSLAVAACALAALGTVATPQNTIRAANTIIDGGQLNRIFDIMSGGVTVQLNNLTLRDGRSLTATFEKADPDSARAGILVRVAPVSGEAGAPATWATLSLPEARFTASDGYFERQIADSVGLDAGLLIAGEPGVTPDTC